MNKKLKHGWLVTLIFSVISLLYLYPIILVVINSFKKKAYISRVPFDLPKDNMFVGLENYIRGIEQTKFFEAFGWSLFITVGGVAVIILCCSMCAWFISRVNTWWTKTDLYALSVCHGGAVSDGNVHFVQDCKYAQTQYSMGADLHLSGVWCRAGGIYVYRIYEVHSTGDRRGGND